MEATMQSIFRHHFPAYARTRTLPHKAYRAANALMQCRTEAMGSHTQRCPDGHYEHIQHHSCRHRSCPRCAALPKAQWVEAQSQRLLSCDHYHVIFTLPHELLPLWQRNVRWFTDTFFKIVSETLQTLLGDERHLGAMPGMLLALHTWGRTLSRHPHIHCLVSGGGLSAAGQWRSIDNGFLVPVRVLKPVYRGKWLSCLEAALAEGVLNYADNETRDAWKRVLKAISRKEWNVRIQERYAHGRGVMLYLARYVKGGALSDRRIVAADEASVSFRYRDHRDGKDKVMRLSAEQFLERVLWHVAEKGQHHIRHHGLYAPQAQAKRARARELLSLTVESRPMKTLDWQGFWADLGQAHRSTCPTCGKRLQRNDRVAAGRRSTTFSINRCRGHRIVQPGVRTDTPDVVSFKRGGSIETDSLFLFGGVQLN